METPKINYKIKIANEKEICQHLKECDGNFFPSLSERINIENYSKKIATKSITFEAWIENILVGLVAIYMDSASHSAFITNVSVLKKYMCNKIAAELTSRCLEYVKQNNFKEIQLEVHKDNGNAIGLYKKFNFIKNGSKGNIDIMRLEIKQ